MDALSKLYSWLTGSWTKQSTFGRAALSCVVLLVIACACGVPLLLLSWMQG